MMPRSLTVPFLSVLTIFHVNFSFASTNPLCRSSDLSALLKFKSSFQVSCDHNSVSTSKLNSWKLGGGLTGADCCSWPGVECDQNSGYVTGLDLGSSCLHGSFDSNNSVFNLLHLKRLNLAFNDFNHSNIPWSFRNLSSLTSLNLSSALFSGEVPYEIFRLLKLEVLDLSQNPGLIGHIPEIRGGNNLKILVLKMTSFSGKLPASIGKLSSLEILDIRFCNFSGFLPYSLGNLSNLAFLDLGANSFTGVIPVSFGYLSKLEYLSLYANNFTSDNLSWIQSLKNLRSLFLRKINLRGAIPSFESFSMLTSLDLGDNQLSGEIPNSLANLTQLEYLDLGLNKLHGSVPVSVSNLKNLRYLNLGQNYLSGSVDFDVFLNLKNLTSLNLALNRLSVITTKTKNSTLPSFVALGLCSCNLVEFPEFLRYQNELQYLDLSINNIRGLVPNWIWNTSTRTLGFFDLSYNLLTGFVDVPAILPWSSLSIFNLSSNMLQGSIPVPVSSTIFYSVSNNSLTGSIPSQLCELSSLQVLDLSNNNLTGRIPECLSNFSNSLSILNLQSNNFEGSVPSRWTKGNGLRMIDLGRNNLQGPLPRSLANCERLEILDLGKNKLNGTFPFWLGTLPELKILNLQSNLFHGSVGSCVSNFTFQKLRIVDLSSNSFSGELPSVCLRSWTAMKVVDQKDIGYMQADTSILMGGTLRPDQYFYSMTMKNKGINMNYSKVNEVFTAMDLSGNRFQGEIPEVIGSLVGLQLLNLSNNMISGLIPSVISRLTLLESLDLSSNQLSGRVPNELKELTFLGTFSVANNQLTGPIPQGNQFDTFQNYSYDGNAGLCGKPLSVKCIDWGSTNQAGTTESEEGSWLQIDFEWKALLIGYGGGLLIGFVLGHFVFVTTVIKIVRLVRFDLTRKSRYNSLNKRLDSSYGMSGSRSTTGYCTRFG